MNTLKPIVVLFTLTLWVSVGCTQAKYTHQNVFSHNDYAQADPFYTAYGARVGFIEADIFLKEDDLLVAHTASALDPAHSLSSMYLSPLNERILKNNNYPFSNTDEKLDLLIDIKSEGISTLNRFVNMMMVYPALVHAKNFQVVISGNVPDTAQWDLFPKFIFFDGRPDREYTKEQWQRIAFVSNDFKKYTAWDGNGKIPPADAKKIHKLLSTIHSKNKKFRFWANADNEKTWRYLIKAKADIIGTDHVMDLVRYLEKK